MKKKNIVGMIIFISLLLAAIFMLISTKASEKTFEAVILNTVIQSDGEVRLIVERTTQIYANPNNSLAISSETSLVDEKGNRAEIAAFQSGTHVKVRLKDAFIEETPFYYPTVYEIRIIK